MPDTRPSALVPSVYQLRVVVRGVSPLTCWRLLIPADTSIAGLRAVLQIAFGWNCVGPHPCAADGRTARGESPPPTVCPALAREHDGQQAARDDEHSQVMDSEMTSKRWSSSAR